MSAIGEVTQAAVQLTEYILGTTTTASGSTKSTNQANTQVTDNSDTDTTTNTSTNSQTVNQNTADPGIIAMLKSLASTAISNSTDPASTTQLLSGVIQTATDAMTTVFGQQKQAGLYNSASATTQNNDIMSRAAADAASAILGYTTQEQGIADTALNQAGALTSGSISTTNADTNTDTNVATNETATTQVSGSSTSQTQSTSKSGLSVVCTFMHHKGLLSVTRYILVTDDFLRKPKYQQLAYYAVAAPLVSILERNHTTKVSRAILSVFHHRTEYICAKRGLTSCRDTKKGWAARALVASICFFPALYFLLLSKLPKLLEDTLHAE